MAINGKNFTSAEVERTMQLAQKIQQEVLQADSEHAEDDKKKPGDKPGRRACPPVPPMPAQQLTEGVKIVSMAPETTIVKRGRRPVFVN